MVQTFILNKLLSGLSIGQVCVIFHLPEEFGTFEHPLAYVEWFTPFKTPLSDLGMYQVSCSTRQNCRRATIIPLPQIERCVHLIPKFGRAMDRTWSTDDVLERCKTFFREPVLPPFGFSVVSLFIFVILYALIYGALSSRFFCHFIVKLVQYEFPPCPTCTRHIHCIRCIRLYPTCITTKIWGFSTNCYRTLRSTKEPRHSGWYVM